MSLKLLVFKRNNRTSGDKQKDMGLFYSESRKELLEKRNRIFLERGVPSLQKNGFSKSPFSTSWYGRNNLKDFSYDFCRVTNNSQLEKITVYISRGDRWIKVFLNIFDLKPSLISIEQLNGIDGLQFVLPPNSISEMRLRIDDTKGMPLFRILFGKEHKIGAYYTKYGLNRNIKKLTKLIENDMTNINNFVRRWHEMHQSMQTNWEGHQVIQ